MEKKIYWTVLLSIFFLLGLFEFVEIIDGLLPGNTVAEFVIQYILIALTLVDIYAALKMIKKNAVLRIMLLAVPAWANVVFYHLFMNNSFLYLTVMILVGFVFVYPSKKAEQ